MANSAVASNDSCIDYMHQIKEMGISEMKRVDNRGKNKCFCFSRINGSVKNGKRGACEQKAATVLPNRTAAA